MDEILALVDKEDRVVGEMEKGKAHRFPGFLHRAFLVMVFNPKGELLLTKRSQDKPLWPGVWDGSVASHPRVGERLEEAVKRRLVEEIGVKNFVDLKHLFEFEYEACWKNEGVEKEICHVFKIICQEGIKPNFREISDFSWISWEKLKQELKKSPADYSPWFKKAFAKYRV